MEQGSSRVRERCPGEGLGLISMALDRLPFTELAAAHESGAGTGLKTSALQELSPLPGAQQTRRAQSCHARNKASAWLGRNSTFAEKSGPPAAFTVARHRRGPRHSLPRKSILSTHRFSKSVSGDEQLSAH
jgi:hypothetical protein